jgi:hypothetical protein
MKAFIYFPGDPSVGIFSETFEMQIPEFDTDYREETRRDIQNLYTEISGGEGCRVSFSDENEIDPESRSKFEDATIEGMQLANEPPEPDFSSDDWEADQLWAERPTPYDP